MGTEKLYFESYVLVNGKISILGCIISKHFYRQFWLKYSIKVRKLRKREIKLEDASNF